MSSAVALFMKSTNSGRRPSLSKLTPASTSACRRRPTCELVAGDFFEGASKVGLSKNTRNERAAPSYFLLRRLFRERRAFLGRKRLGGRTLRRMRSKSVVSLVPSSAITHSPPCQRSCRLS